jgi:AraC-like DNA-binding protein
MHSATKKRSFHSLSIRTRGSAEIHCGHETLHVETGDLLYIPPAVDYSQSTDGEEIIVVHFEMPDLQHDRIVHFATMNKTTHSFLYHEMHQIWTQRAPGYYQKCMSVFYELLYLISQESYSSMLKSYAGRDFQQALEYINLHFTDKALSIPHLAEMAKVSEVYFRKLFHKNLGVSPSKYIHHLRIERAKELLASGYYAVYECAELAGFTDTKYFSTAFKKATGISPSAFLELEEQ